MSQTIADIISNPSYHDYLAILKGARNGFVYGVKVRFPHALVMSILFGRGRCVCLVSVRTHNINNPPHLSIIGLLAPLGTCHIPIHFPNISWQDRAKVIFRATKQHAFNLAKFVSLYKICLLIQKRANGGKPRNSDTFIAGLLSGYLVFGERNAVNEQVRIDLSPTDRGSRPIDCSLCCLTRRRILRTPVNFFLQDFSPVSASQLSCKAYSSKFARLFPICCSRLGFCHVALPKQGRNNPAWHVPLHDIPLP